MSDPTPPGSVQVTNVPRRLEWKLTGGPIFRVSYELFGEFRLQAPREWDWKVAGYDNIEQRFDIWINPDSPREVETRWRDK